MNEAEGGPVRERAKDELRECQTLVQRLFESHASLLNGRHSAKQIERQTLQPVQLMQKLVAQQNSLRKLVDLVVEHQHQNAIIEQLRRANAAEDTKLAHLGTSLRAAEAVLQNALDEARPRVAALRRANKRPVDVDEVISYGSKISASLSAPPEWRPSMPLGKHLPPAPTEDMMRAGRLAAVSMEEQEKATKVQSSG